MRHKRWITWRIAFLTKLHTLSSAQLAEVERFLESLRISNRDPTHAWARASEPALEAVWSNPEDDVYNTL